MRPSLMRTACSSVAAFTVLYLAAGMGQSIADVLDHGGLMRDRSAEFNLTLALVMWGSHLPVAAGGHLVGELLLHLLSRGATPRERVGVAAAAGLLSALLVFRIESLVWFWTVGLVCTIFASAVWSGLRGSPGRGR